MKYKLFFLFFLLCITFIFYSCSDSNSVYSNGIINEPVVTGFIITTENGNKLGKYGTPNDNRGDFESSGISEYNNGITGIYPNPSYGNFTFGINIQSQSNVKIYFIRAKSKQENIKFFNNAYLIKPKEKFQILLFEGYMNAGRHNFEILTSKIENMKEGVYRIYLQIESNRKTEIYWTDAISADKKENLDYILYNYIY